MHGQTCLGGGRDVSRHLTLHFSGEGDGDAPCVLRPGGAKSQLQLLSLRQQQHSLFARARARWRARRAPLALRAAAAAAARRARALPRCTLFRSDVTHNHSTARRTHAPHARLPPFRLARAAGGALARGAARRANARACFAAPCCNARGYTRTWRARARAARSCWWWRSAPPDQTGHGFAFYRAAAPHRLPRCRLALRALARTRALALSMIIHGALFWCVFAFSFYAYRWRARFAAARSVDQAMMGAPQTRAAA